jgi:hypothetical protein
VTTNSDNTLKVTVTTPHKMKTSLLTSDFCLSSIFYRILSYSFSEVGSGRTAWRSPPSTVELSLASLLLCFGGSLPCEGKRFCMRYIGIDVSLCNVLLLQSYSLLFERVPTIDCPAAAPSVLPRERAQRSAVQEMDRLQISGITPQCKT